MLCGFMWRVQDFFSSGADSIFREMVEILIHMGQNNFCHWGIRDERGGGQNILLKIKRG